LFFAGCSGRGAGREHLQRVIAIKIKYERPDPWRRGDTLMVTMTIGAGTIGGGTKATVNRVRFELTGDAGSPLVSVARTMA
jgi:hypothetical protein